MIRIKQSSQPLRMERMSRAAVSIAADASLLAAAGAFLGVTLLAVAAAGLVVAGGVAHSQLKLASASVEALNP